MPIPAGPPPALDVTSPLGQVRLLINDVDDTDQAGGLVFSDAEITAFLTMEAGVVKRAAALAIETNADNEVLASKVLSTQDVSTHGEAVSAALLQRAAKLRDQADLDEERGDDFFAGVQDMVPLPVYPELTDRPIDFCW